ESAKRWPQQGNFGCPVRNGGEAPCAAAESGLPHVPHKRSLRMIVTMKTEGGGSHGVLAGSAEGRNFLANMVRKTGGYSIEPEAILLDFTGIEVATSSYLREGVVRLRDMLRSRGSNFYPIVANACDAVMEELTMLLHDHGDSMLAC